MAFSQEPARRATSPVVMRIETQSVVISSAGHSLVSPVGAAMARLRSEGVSGRHLIEVTPACAGRFTYRGTRTGDLPPLGGLQAQA